MTRSAAPRRKTGASSRKPSAETPSPEAFEPAAEAKPRRRARLNLVEVPAPEGPAAEASPERGLALEAGRASAAPAREGLLYRRRRTLTAAAIIVACAGSATVGLVKAMGPHGPFRTVSSHPQPSASFACRAEP